MHSHISCTHVGNGFFFQFGISKVIRYNDGISASYGPESLSRRNMNAFLSDYVRNSSRKKLIKVKVY